jgi:hypothetical protein
LDPLKVTEPGKKGGTAMENQSVGDSWLQSIEVC